MNDKERTKRVLNAARFFNMGEHYRVAADELVAVSNMDKAKRSALRDPTYLLYFHAFESVLRAFVLLNGVPLDGVRHDLMALYDKAVAAGLDRERRALTVVSCMADANKDHALRYFTIHSTGAPELEWTKEVILELMESVRSAIEAIDPDAFKPGPAVKAAITWGRITPDPA